MGSENLEIEVKFYLQDLLGLERKLVRQNTELVQPRTHELNLRFDTPEGDLTGQRRVLRLRQDQKTWLTYKGPAQQGQPVGVRQEIEFEVSDFENARRFLNALGYHVCVMYEKYRRVYRFGEVQVMLDELPYGNFVEIEGLQVEAIQAAAMALGLDWEARITASYLELFNRLKARYGLTIHHLCFNEFTGLRPTPEDLGLRSADMS